ncbi:recombinase family protein [Pseudomonas oryzihabitans]|uniref:recombinase family protein n=1 Tax=Pseudomonas oryzihabitans TaxID=47885 RepID=UPI0011AB20FE|nr:recombinase family protein [Pseudomonas oryzihabitans]
MAVIGYLRVSTNDQSVESQKHSLSEFNVDLWYSDEGVSGAVKAMDRPGFAKLAAYLRDGDTLIVSAVDRLGRDTIDVLSTVETLKAKGVRIVSKREGFDLSTPIGVAMLTMLAAVAQLERSNIKARQMSGIEKARQEGKSLGRTKTIADAEVASWRKENSASIAQTAEKFGISVASVKRACAKV